MQKDEIIKKMVPTEYGLSFLLSDILGTNKGHDL